MQRGVDYPPSGALPKKKKKKKPSVFLAECSMEDGQLVKGQWVFRRHAIGIYYRWAPEIVFSDSPHHPHLQLWLIGLGMHWGRNCVFGI